MGGIIPSHGKVRRKLVAALAKGWRWGSTVGESWRKAGGPVAGAVRQEVCGGPQEAKLQRLGSSYSKTRGNVMGCYNTQTLFVYSFSIHSRLLYSSIEQNIVE